MSDYVILPCVGAGDSGVSASTTKYNKADDGWYLCCIRGCGLVLLGRWAQRLLCLWCDRATLLNWPCLMPYDLAFSHVMAN